jgi:NADH-quinone oxidoreductase subunit C
MLNEDFKIHILELYALAKFDETGEWLNVMIEPQDWKTIAHKFRSIPAFNLDYLFCLTCIDWKTHFTMVYHLTSTTHRHNIVIKCKLDRNDPNIDTVSDIWRTAEFHEREVYDLFGVKFINHPDLRRLLLTDEWEGYPLRKDYEDPINMIKL